MTEEVQTQQAQAFTFQLTVDECNVIFAGLGEIPTKLGKPVMDKMQFQFAQQVPQQEASKQEPVAE